VAADRIAKKYNHSLTGSRCQWLARCEHDATHTAWAGPGAGFLDACDVCHSKNKGGRATFTQTFYWHSSPLCDGPWTIIAVDGDGKASDGSPSHGHGEAGVERVDTGFWLVWGYNRESGQCYQNSTHQTKAEALATAADLAAGTGYERED
jgi:hypothetical protein